MTFRKTGSSAGIATEAASLRWLAEAGGAPVAELVDVGADWLETVTLAHGSPSAEDARRFGRALAHTHAAGADFWGQAPPGLALEDARLAEVPATRVSEPTWRTWGAFYAEAELLPYLRRSRLSPEDHAVIARAIERVGEGRFDAPQPALVESVARIHGDLWSGNVLWPDGVGTLIDPSAHGGHAETDLAELGVFGAPHLRAILEGYDEVSELADGWRERVGVHQFHMLLVHVALFGGSYVGQTLGVARELLR